MKYKNTVRKFDEQDFEYMKEWSSQGFIEKLDSLALSIKSQKLMVFEKDELQGEVAKQCAYLKRVLFRDIKYFVNDIEKHLIEIERTGVWR